MKHILFILSILSAITANAQSYLIYFLGSEASTIVDSVKVDNLSTGNSKTINGGDVLRLTLSTSINSPDYNQLSELKIFPNPMTDNSTLFIYAPEAGKAVISVLDISGKLVAQTQSSLEKLPSAFRLSGLKNGFYLINVKGSNYQFSEKLFSNGKSNGTVRIEKVNSIVQDVDEKGERFNSKGTQVFVDMAYTTGNRLKFTGMSGDFSTVKTDIPSGDKTITFKFMACKDGDNNNYPIVEIGTQTWMAKNLKTTKYSNGDLIGTTFPATLDISAEITPKYQWAFAGDENNVPIYGRLYTWYAGTDSRNICPVNWRVPTDADWTKLTNYLGGTTLAGGKLKETGSTHWKIPNQFATNETGYTALPGGYRYYGQTFYDAGYQGSWWSSTEFYSNAWSRDLHSEYNGVDRMNVPGHTGLSIRCLED